jgi:hypothetical protein
MGWEIAGRIEFVEAAAKHLTDRKSCGNHE